MIFLPIFQVTVGYFQLQHALSAPAPVQVSHVEKQGAGKGEKF